MATTSQAKRQPNEVEFIVILRRVNVTFHLSSKHYTGGRSYAHLCGNTHADDSMDPVTARGKGVDTGGGGGALGA